VENYLGDLFDRINNWAVQFLFDHVGLINGLSQLLIQFL
jgi:hypothetical protein